MTKPDLRDVHIYGGMLGVAIGVMGYAGWQGFLITLGAVCFYVGVFRMGRL
jgi:hypothetical protein